MASIINMLYILNMLTTFLLGCPQETNQKRFDATQAAVLSPGHPARVAATHPAPEAPLQ